MHVLSAADHGASWRNVTVKRQLLYVLHLCLTSVYLKREIWGCRGEIGSNEPNICDITCTCKGLAHLATLRVTSSSMKRPLGNEVYPVVLWSSEVVVDWASYQKVFIAMGSGFSMDQPKNHFLFWILMLYCNESVTYATIARHPRTLFQAGVLLLPRRLRRIPVSFYVILFPPAVETRRETFQGIPTGNFIIPVVVFAKRWFAIIAKRRYSIHRILRQKCGNVPTPFHCYIRFTPKKLH